MTIEQLQEEVNAIYATIKEMEEDNEARKQNGLSAMWTLLDFLDTEHSYRYALNELNKACNDWSLIDTLASPASGGAESAQAPK